MLGRRTGQLRMHYPAAASTIPLNNLAAFCYCMVGNPECQCGAVVMAVIMAVSVFAGDPVSNLGARSVHPGALALPLTHLPAPSCHHVTHPPPPLSCPYLMSIIRTYLRDAVGEPTLCSKFGLQAEPEPDRPCRSSCAPSESGGVTIPR